MPETGVPFIVDASNVALVEDLNDVPFGEALSIDVLLSDLESGDVVSSMVFVAKANVADSDLNPLTIIETITASPASQGVIVPTSDPTAYRGVFQLTRSQGIRLSTRTTYQYSVTATVHRAGVDVIRLVQRGALTVQFFPSVFAIPLADGTWIADGTLLADGFD